MSAAPVEGKRVRVTVKVTGTIEATPARALTLAEIEADTRDTLLQILRAEGFEDYPEYGVVTTLDVTATAEEVPA
jgi:hypothetical protein